MIIYASKYRLKNMTTIPHKNENIGIWLNPYEWETGISSSRAIYTMIPAIADSR